MDIIIPNNDSINPKIILFSIIKLYMVVIFKLYLSR